MRLFWVMIRLLLVILPANVYSADRDAVIARIKRELSDPDSALKGNGSLVVMGNAPLDQAKALLCRTPGLAV